MDREALEELYGAMVDSFNECVQLVENLDSKLFTIDQNLLLFKQKMLEKKD